MCERAPKQPSERAYVAPEPKPEPKPPVSAGAGREERASPAQLTLFALYFPRHSRCCRVLLLTLTEKHDTAASSAGHLNRIERWDLLFPLNNPLGLIHTVRWAHAGDTAKAQAADWRHSVKNTAERGSRGFTTQQLSFLSAGSTAPPGGE
ncbi:hypothetical protein SRHO_G00234300 [Serrasalmus rhombeus]